MNIIITDLEEKILVVLDFAGYTAEEFQEEIKRTGSQEKVIGFLQFPKDDELGRLLSALCAFGNGIEGSFQYDFEKLLGKILQLGYKHGFTTARETLKRNLHRVVDYMAEQAGLGQSVLDQKE